MNKTSLGRVFLAAAILTGGASTAAAQPAAAAISPAEYLRQAGASDLFEIQSSQAVLPKTSDADVRKFTQMMLRDHTKSTQDLKAAAQTGGVSMPAPVLDRDTAAKVEALREAPAGQVDSLYLRDQVAAHEHALALHQGYAERGDNPALKQAAAKIAPVVQAHLDQARSLAGKGK
jgi:putative membrane protein